MNALPPAEVLAPYAGVIGVTALAALLVSLLIVFTSHLHGPLSMDHPGSVQTAHIHPTPRIGGVGIYLGLFLAWLLLPEGEARDMLGLLVLAGLPACRRGGLGWRKTSPNGSASCLACWPPCSAARWRA